MQVKDIITVLEEEFPVEYQEKYDNSGLILGSKESDVSSALVCLDVSESVIDEAISKNCELIISHHPFIFNAIRKISQDSSFGRCIYKAIQNNIAIYACHTNLDNSFGGLNWHVAEKLGLKEVRPLSQLDGTLMKLVTFCPVDHIDKVRSAVFSAGAGFIGNYDSCSFNIEGEGSFRALEMANPFVGSKNELHFEKEIRFESVFPSYLKGRIIDALLKSHPYEEVAYDVYSLANTNPNIGSGIIGELDYEINPSDFLKEIKNIFLIKTIRHTRLPETDIKRVAYCGGAGGFLIPEAIRNMADIYITSDLKYHDFFIDTNSVILADIGHYESEHSAMELIFNTLRKKMPNFALVLSEINTNPICYL